MTQDYDYISKDIFVLDGRKMISQEAFWQEYLQVVKPTGADIFGRNLAAFNDAVTGGGPGWPGDNCVLRIEHHKIAVKHLGQKFFDQLKEIEKDSSSLWGPKQFSIEFA